MANLRSLNILLLIIAIILFLNLAGTKTAGFFALALDKSEPKCIFELDNEAANIPDINECCFLLQEQLGCIASETNQAEFICKTADAGPKYIVNKKTITYCTYEGYTIKRG